MLSLYAYACKVLAGLEKQPTDDGIMMSSLAPEGVCKHILRALVLMGHEHRRPALLSPHVSWRQCSYVIQSTTFCFHLRLGSAERGCPLAPLAQVQTSGIPGS